MAGALIKSRPAIKAIETLYDGHRFRSRLEARWAVFMDCLKVQYDYEPEGYESGSTRYLPDFYLPDHDCFIEIKPSLECFDDTAREKVSMLASGSGKAVYVFAGACAPPGEPCIGKNYQHQGYENGAIPFNSPQLDEKFRHDRKDRSFFWCACFQCMKVRIGLIGWVGCECEWAETLVTQKSPIILAAFAIAGKIRFDHPGAAKLDKFIIRDMWRRLFTEMMDSYSIVAKLTDSKAAEITREIECDDFKMDDLKRKQRW
jgi:hypothetical protein